MLALNEKLNSRPLTVPLICCSPKVCEEYDPDNVSACCLSVTVGVPEPAPVFTVKRQVPVRLGGVSCACTDPPLRIIAAVTSAIAGREIERKQTIKRSVVVIDVAP